MRTRGCAVRIIQPNASMKLISVNYVSYIGEDCLAESLVVKDLSVGGAGQPEWTDAVGLEVELDGETRDDFVALGNSDKNRESASGEIFGPEVVLVPPKISSECVTDVEFARDPVGEESMRRSRLLGKEAVKGEIGLEQQKADRVEKHKGGNKLRPSPNKPRRGEGAVGMAHEACLRVVPGAEHFLHANGDFLAAGHGGGPHGDEGQIDQKYIAVRKPLLEVTNQRKVRQLTYT